MTEHMIAFWNLENLFDIERSPRRSEKLERTLGTELKGWSQTVLDKKIDQLASVIIAMNNGQGPDLLGVCEVENKHVLSLLKDRIKQLGRTYKVAHADTADKRGIDVAFLYDGTRFAVDEIFNHFIVKRTATRDLVQLNMTTANGAKFSVIGCHWPSRSGGQLESEPFRMLAAETLAYFHERILEVHGKDTSIMAMGDLNDEPFNRSVTDYALGERTRGKVTRARTAPRMLNLMWPMVGRSVGTHYYNGQPNVLDQILVNRPLLTGAGGVHVKDDSAGVFTLPAMITSSSNAAPKRFGRGKTLDKTGYSDHFPVFCTVRE